MLGKPMSIHVALYHKGAGAIKCIFNLCIGHIGASGQREGVYLMVLVKGIACEHALNTIHRYSLKLRIYQAIECILLNGSCIRAHCDNMIL